MTRKESAAKKEVREDAPEMTAIERNPFALLSASIRDDRKRIVELAEEKSFSGDHDACTKARSDLTNPRNRLSCELSWLPGVAPKKANELIALLRKDPEKLREAKGKVPAIAQANLIASAMELLDDDLSVEEWAAWIKDLAAATDGIKAEKILRDINEDRAISGFTEVKGVELIEAEINERLRAYKAAVKNALERQEPEKLTDIVTLVVDETTHHGENHAPTLIDDMVDVYILGTQAFLRREADKIIEALQKIPLLASDGETKVLAGIKTVKGAIEYWDKFAQPIQVSMKSRGMKHDLSRELARELRDLLIGLASEHDMIKAASALTDILKEVFAELPDFAEQAEKDSSDLIALAERNERDAAEMSYEAQLGTIFKDKLAISLKGIEWKGEKYPLESIKTVSWGGTRHSVNGIPTGTNYTINFSDGNRSQTIETRKQEVYSEFIQRLWQGVCVRLMFEMLIAFQEGKKLHFAGIAVDDNGVELTRAKFFKSEKVYVKWGDVHILNANGCFVIRSKTEKNVSCQMPYITTANAHVLEHIISTAFKSWRGRLSGLLEK